MPESKDSVIMSRFNKEKVSTVISSNGKYISQFIFAALFIYMASWFISHQRAELSSVWSSILRADRYWIFSGFALVILYIYAQGIMYVASFAAISVKIKVWEAIILFLKKNFISVFLPAGGVTSLAFFNKEIERKGVTRTQIYLASSIRAFVGILSVVIIAIPSFLLIITGADLGTSKWYALAGVILILVLSYFAYYSLSGKGVIYKLMVRVMPKSMVFLDDMNSNRINRKELLYIILISILIDIIGIFLVYVSMLALNSPASLPTAIIAYIVVVLFLIISPFMRGLGAIEVSMTYVLIKSGFSNVESISITLVFRFFEFWVPLFAGLLSFFLKIEKFLLRVLPAVLIFFLGIINIISVLTPVVPERLRILKDYLLVDVISFSNSFVLVAGLFLLITAAFMLRGLRTSWWFAMAFTMISVFGHITKGIDYEEATTALFIAGALLVTRKEYCVRSSPELGNTGLWTAFLSVAAVMIYGIVGFYFLDKNHFHNDFTILQSFKYTMLNFFLIGSRELVAYDAFARDFMYLIRISGFASIAFLIYTFIRPYVLTNEPTKAEIERATMLIKLYGKSSLDFFKTYSDKFIFAPPDINAFISYKVSTTFAVALENPVAENEAEMKKCIIAFGKFCYQNGLKEIFYRVPKESLPLYSELSMKSLFIGQEGIADLNSFSLEGGEKKSIRNALNKTREQGYSVQINKPPLRDGLIQKLKSVSEEWLKSTGRHEISFSQGVFSEKEIKEQTVISIENREEKIICFLNIIPDYSKDEGTYDLLRKTVDAPNGVMDYIIVEMFKYFRSVGIRYVNLGFAPMSGIDDPHNFPEKSMKFAYEKIRSFSHYKGQREYKAKFNAQWNDKFLIYRNDYDLLQIPAALAKVIKI